MYSDMHALWYVLYRRSTRISTHFSFPVDRLLLFVSEFRPGVEGPFVSAMRYWSFARDRIVSHARKSTVNIFPKI